MSLSWSVPDLLKYRQEGLSFHEKVVLPLEQFRADPEIRNVSPIDVEDVAEFSRRSVTFHLHIAGTMVLPCAVTLEDVDYPFSIRTAETFLLDGSTVGGDDEEGELVHRVKDERIDLVPLVVEAILVEKPMRVVSEKAKTAPNFSGEGWTLVTEQSAKHQVDPRLEKLKKFFDE
ncbi:hypothetical protein EWH99_00980 [Sporolactobacillus sp. THM7-7]|nr:hypothetical protein EWH99_00980 [Sporolactobacillus sp. THM7-7]